MRALALASHLFVVVLVALPASRAEACSCAELGVEEAIAGAHAIFEGVVDSSEVDDAADVRVVRFAVTQAWRGVSTERVEVHTHASEAACGYSFEVGRAYLVYASRASDDGLRVSLCSRTRLMDEAGEDRRVLGSGVVPVDVVDEEIEPVRPARTAPSRAGCASCASLGLGSDGWLALAAVLVVIVALRARVARRTRA